MGSTSGWGITADILREERQDGEWRKAYERQWCPGPAEHEGHLLPCDVGEAGHEGECVATARTVARHRLAGQKACIKHNCGGIP